MTLKDVTRIIYGAAIDDNVGIMATHDDVIKWRHFPRYWSLVRGIHRSPVNSPHKGQWRGALMFSLICVWINGWVNNGEACDLRRHRPHYDVIVMSCFWVTYLPSHKPQIEYVYPGRVALPNIWKGRRKTTAWQPAGRFNTRCVCVCYDNIFQKFQSHPDSKVHGANMGPIWGRQDPGGPHVGPLNLAIWARYIDGLVQDCSNYGVTAVLN